jgi:branched-chain amino acid transport system substrate-binding protein
MKAAFAAALLAAAGIVFVSAAKSETVVKIGVINSYTGFIAEAAAEAQRGFDLYLKEHQKDLPPGVRIEILRRDDTASPEVGKRLAQELIAREHVQLLTGLLQSPIAAAIAPLTAEAKVPMLISFAAGGSALTRLSPYVARLSFTLWQEGYPIGKWAAEQGWKTAFTAVSDYIPGHDSEASFAKGFTDGGGRMLGSVRFPPATIDFAPFVQRIRDTRPDVAFLWVPSGPQSTALIRSIRDLGLREAGIHITSSENLLPDEELPNMGDTPLGIISSGIYSTAAERPANRAFLAAWQQEYGERDIPDYLSVDGWDGMHAIVDLVRKTGGTFTAEQAMEFFRNWKDPDSPRGPIMIDPDTRDIVQNVYIRRAEKRDDKLANIEIATIPQVKDPWKELNPEKK